MAIKGEGDYSTGATPLMGGAAMGEGGEMIGGGGGGGDLDWMGEQQGGEGFREGDMRWGKWG